MPHKKRGAPRGNHNALKHGFYSAAFKEQELRLLHELPVTDLSAEVDLIRVMSYRFLQALNASPASLDVETQLAALRAVSLSAHSITRLLHVQLLLSHLNDTPLPAFVRTLGTAQASPPQDNAALHLEEATANQRSCHQPPSSIVDDDSLPQSKV